MLPLFVRGILVKRATLDTSSLQMFMNMTPSCEYQHSDYGGTCINDSPHANISIVTMAAGAGYVWLSALAYSIDRAHRVSLEAAPCKYRFLI